MSEFLQAFGSGNTYAIVRLPHAIDDIIADWGRVRENMLRTRHEGFSRDEWAYLISFLDAKNLIRPFEFSFGKHVSLGEAAADRYTLYRLRGRIAVWLPGNVSLLGPLMLVLVSLTGADLRMKASSRGANLTAEFADYVKNILIDGVLLTYLGLRASVEYFDHNDQRMLQMARDSSVRVFFGGDEAAKAVEALPHPVGSEGVYFTDKVSEAWCEWSGRMHFAKASGVDQWFARGCGIG